MRKIRFSLRTLVAGVLVVSGLLGWYSTPADTGKASFSELLSPGVCHLARRAPRWKPGARGERGAGAPSPLERGALSTVSPNGAREEGPGVIAPCAPSHALSGLTADSLHLTQGSPRTTAARATLGFVAQSLRDGIPEFTSPAAVPPLGGNAAQPHANGVEHHSPGLPPQRGATLGPRPEYTIPTRYGLRITISRPNHIDRSGKPPAPCLRNHLRG